VISSDRFAIEYHTIPGFDAGPNAAVASELGKRVISTVRNRLLVNSSGNTWRPSKPDVQGSVRAPINVIRCGLPSRIIPAPAREWIVSPRALRQAGAARTPASALAGYCVDAVRNAVVMGGFYDGRTQTIESGKPRLSEDELLEVIESVPELGQPKPTNAEEFAWDVAGVAADVFSSVSGSDRFPPVTCNIEVMEPGAYGALRARSINEHRASLAGVG
jgi:hypothetical protein